MCDVIIREFKKISKHTIAKAMWDKHEVTYEGTNQVKEVRISMLIHEYVIFKMEKGEKVEQMFERLFVTINDLYECYHS